MTRSLLLLVPVLALVWIGPLAAADWPQFRGSRSDGVASDGRGPASFRVAWEAALPGRGLSGPTVVGDRVVVTSSSGYRQDRLHVTCFDAAEGRLLWERQFWATGRTQCHPRMCVATPQPASDGERIFAFYSSNDLACLDLDGNLLWFRGLTHDYPNASNSLGMASSPVVAGDTLVVQVESDAEAFALGLDVETGVHRWKIPRPRHANWTSPAVWNGKDGSPDLVLLQSSAGVSAVDPRTGVEAWAYREGASTIPSFVVAGDAVFVPSHGITALRPIPASEAPEILWREGGLSPSTPSPLVHEGRLFTINTAGALTCADLESGKRLWQLRLGGAVTSSPVAADGRLYLFTESGTGLIVEPSDRRGEIVTTVDLEEDILCTPALAGGALYVRSDGRLWKFD